MNRGSALPRFGLSRRVVLGRAAALGAAFGIGGVRRATAQETTPVPLQFDDGVVYGETGGVDLTLDVARPEDRPEPRPGVVVIHGGGFVAGGPYEVHGPAQGLANAGYVTFNLSYRLYSRVNRTNPWPAQLDDVQRAVRWVRANAATYNVDPERIGAFGWSSGGQLAAFLGTRETRDNADPGLAAFSSRATCVAAVGGVFDMTIRYENAADNAVDAEVLGGTADAPPDEAAYLDFSPIAFVDEESAPFLIMQEGADRIVPMEHSQRMVAALQAAGVEVTYAWFPHYNHMSWRFWKSEAPETLAFFGRHLQPER